MPTYTFKCPQCGVVRDLFATISDYISPDFKPPECHAPMHRFFTAADPMHALDALTSDAIYDGLKAPDGSDISTRAKHREYMKRNNLTTIDDFTETWKRNEQERASTLAGEDPHRVRDVVDAWNRHDR